jgi:hypothetical protein
VRRGHRDLERIRCIGGLPATSTTMSSRGGSSPLTHFAAARTNHAPSCGQESSRGQGSGINERSRKATHYGRSRIPRVPNASPSAKNWALGEDTSPSVALGEE